MCRSLVGQQKNKVCNVAEVTEVFKDNYKRRAMEIARFFRLDFFLL